MKTEAVAKLPAPEKSGILSQFVEDAMRPASHRRAHTQESRARRWDGKMAQKGDFAGAGSSATASAIIIYADKGVDGGALKQLMRSLQGAVDPARYTIKRMDAKALIEQPWEESASLLIFPGGRDVFYHAALDGAGTDKIRAYVENGGKYLGICAGAYFACREIEFEKGGILEVCAPRSLRFFPGVAKGPAYGPNRYSYETAKGAEAAKISWNEGDCHVYFNGGCTFESEEYHSGIRFLSHYLDLDNQPVAILEIEYGKGLVLLSGVHFEYSSKYLKQDDPHLDRLYATLSPAEEKRQALFNEVLDRLEIKEK